MNCPLCSAQSDLAMSIKGYSIRDCASCRHRFADISVHDDRFDTIFGDDYFFNGSAGYADYYSEGEMLEGRGRWYANKIERFVETGSVLDVGAAAGFILKGFQDNGWSGIGVEPNPAMARYGREKLNLDIRAGAFEDFETDVRFDLVSMIQVAAHFFDPKRAFIRASQLLKPGGHLLVETWDQGSLSARLFGRNWHEYSPPSVLHWFSRKRLAKFLEELNFMQIASGRPRKSIVGAHAKSLLEYRLGKLRILGLIPERMEIPYPSEDLFWSLYKISD